MNAATTHWLILTGEYPPDTGGVGDYTHLVATALAEAGDVVHVATPRARTVSDNTATEESSSVHLLYLSDHFGPRGLMELSDYLRRLPATSTRVLVQYVPHAFGMKSMNLLVCAWLLFQRGVAVDLMFHEVAMPLDRRQPLSHTLLGFVHRVMAFLMIQNASRIFVSTTAWQKLVRPLVFNGAPIALLPIPSNLPTVADMASANELRATFAPGAQLVGYFGHASSTLRDTLCEAMKRILAAESSSVAVFISHSAEQVRDAVLAISGATPERVRAIAAPNAAAAANAITSCDLMVQPYPDGVSTRRSSVMAALALGVPIVTAEGALTESCWRRESPVRLAPPDAVALAEAAIELLSAPVAERNALGQRGQAFYQSNFALANTIELLRRHSASSATAARITGRTTTRQLFTGILQRLPRRWIDTATEWRGRSRLIKSLTDFIPGLLKHQDAIIQRGPGQGLRFNASGSAAGFVLGTHDPVVQQVLATLIEPGSVVYDIGANVGFTSVIAARFAGPAGRVICFEPLNENAAQLRVNADLNSFDSIQIHAIALGSADGEAEFATSHAPTWGRLIRSGFTPMQKQVCRVPVRSLDSMMQTDRLPPPAFIKMDVEGAEAEVLTGAMNLLRSHRPRLVIELHHTNEQVIPLLESIGYVVRPLVRQGAPTSVDVEIQILAYQPGDDRAAQVADDVASGRIG